MIFLHVSFKHSNMSSMKYPFWILRDNISTTCCIYSSKCEAHYLSMPRTYTHIHKHAHTYSHAHTIKGTIILTSISILDKYVGMYVQKPFWKPCEECYRKVLRNIIHLSNNSITIANAHVTYFKVFWMVVGVFVHASTIMVH